jgi:hypothetical protein
LSVEGDRIGLYGAHSRVYFTLGGRNRMLWTIIVILLILWLLGGFVRPVGGFIHLLLVIILILVIIQLL